MVRAELGLVCRVEGGEPGARHAGGERGLPARVGEHARDEARAQGGVAQASLLLDGEERQARHDRAREEARAAPPRPPAVAECWPALTIPTRGSVPIGGGLSRWLRFAGLSFSLASYKYWFSILLSFLNGIFELAGLLGENA